MAAQDSKSVLVPIAIGAVLAAALGLWLVSGDDEPSPEPGFMSDTDRSTRSTESADADRGRPGRSTAPDSSGVDGPDRSAPVRRTEPAPGDAREERFEETFAAQAPDGSWVEDRYTLPTDGELAAMQRDAENELPPPDVMEQLIREGKEEPDQAVVDRLVAESLAVQEPSPQEIERMRREAEIEPTPEQLERIWREADEY